MKHRTNSSGVGNSAEAVSTRVVKHVATVSNREISQVPPLYGTIDPEALDALIESVAASPSSLELQFAYDDHLITIDETGSVSVER